MKNYYFKLVLIISLLVCFCLLQASAQNIPLTGVQNRVVVFARFNGDPEIDTPRSHFETMFNSESNSMKSYFKAISNEKLTLNTLMFPENNSVNTSIELKYCYYCYDNSWKGNYPNCKGSDIASSFEVNIGFIVKELAEKLEVYGNLPDGNSLDSNNDGYIDNFVIVFRGAGRGPGKGIYTPQTGSISDAFTNSNGEIKLNGKTIKNYTITFERNSLETHSRFMLSALGFPALYRNSRNHPRSAGMFDPMDGTELSYPLVYNRMKYSHAQWIEEIPSIIAPGVYSLSSADSKTNNAYKLASSNWQQFWILEYRDKTAEWESPLPESGLLIYRVDTRYKGAVGSNSEIYLYRKDGTFNVAGNIEDAPFSNINGRIAFNSLSNPASFFSDGTLSDDIDISDITFDGDKMTFKVNKATLDDAQIDEELGWKMYYDHAQKEIQVAGEGIEALSVYDIHGRLLNSFAVNNTSAIGLEEYNPGVYIALLSGKKAQKTFKFIAR